MNGAKGREIAELLADLPYDVRTLAEFPGATLPEETEKTYEGNARLKARAGARLTGELTLADDSGIEVDALDGAPGVRSARFGGPDLDDAGRNRALLLTLRSVPDERRTARYRCVMVLVDPATGVETTTEGSVEGVLLREPRGDGGFGYDPLFHYPPYGRTFAEVSPQAKARVSHRGLALARAREILAAMRTS